MKAVRETVAELDQYWFGWGSPVALGLFRIVTGVLAFVNFCLIAVDFDAWYSERGYVPLHTSEQWMTPIERQFQTPWFQGGHYVPHYVWNLPFTVPRLNLLSYVANTPITLAFYVLVVLVAAFTAMGLWTKVSSIVLAVGVVSLHHRNPVILHGGDTVVRLACMYVALAPAGATCSLDRLIGLWKGRIKPGPVIAPLWVQRLITFNVGLLYLTSVWVKWDGSHWRDGTATWYPARLNEFVRLPYPDFLRQIPMVQVTTYGTLLTEFALGTLVFYKPLRKWVLLGGIMMHGYIEYSMNIPLFSFMVISLYICFYSGEEIAGWAKRVGQGMQVLQAHIALPAGREFTPEAAALFDAVDPLQLVDYRSGNADTFTAKNNAGKALEPYRSSRSRSIGAFLIWLVPGLWRKMFDAGLQAAPAPKKTERPLAKAKR